MIIVLIVINIILALFFHILCGSPYVHEYLPGKYGIRSRNSYLDIETYTRSYNTIKIWKKPTCKLFNDRCLGHNLMKLRSICNGL